MPEQEANADELKETLRRMEKDLAMVRKHLGD
jgi:hypothetical protein